MCIKAISEMALRQQVEFTSGVMDRMQKIVLLYVLTCLRQNALGHEIINGEIANDDSWQFMASLRKAGKHHCGGSLITRDLVLTAAHCSDITDVFLGTRNFAKNSGVKAMITKKYIYPDYVEPGKGDDIMLLKLSSAVQVGKGIQLIDLPRPGFTLRENEICEVAGWGITEKSRSGSSILLKTKVSVISHQFCESELKGLTKNVICAGGYNTTKGFCQGDSGGPLVYNKMAVGVVSFNLKENCDYPNKPNVYTDVSKFLPWINKIVRGGRSL